jgi:hypothetical protein
MSFFDFAQATREKPKVPANPFAKQLEPPSNPFARQADSAPQSSDTFPKFALPTPKKVTFLQPISTPRRQDTAEPDGPITEDTIEDHIRRLEEGIRSLESWAQAQRRLLEGIQEEVVASSSAIAEFLAKIAT